MQPHPPHSPVAVALTKNLNATWYFQNLDFLMSWKKKKKKKNSKKGYNFCFWQEKDQVDVYFSSYGK